MPTSIIRTGNSTGIGTGTTRTLISPAAGLKLPQTARALLAFNPKHGVITPTAGQTVNTKFELESADITKIKPFETLASPIGAGLGTFANTFTGNEMYRCDVPLYGGEVVDVYATALVANTVAPEAMAFLVVSDDVKDLLPKWKYPQVPALRPDATIDDLIRMGLMPAPQRHVKLGTLTATGTTADTDVAGTVYSFSGARRIVELLGVFHPKTIAAGDMFIGEIKFDSSEFDTSLKQTLPLHTISSGLGTASQSFLIPGVSRMDVNIPTKYPGQVNIQDNLNFGGVIGTAGSFIDGVVYV